MFISLLILTISGSAGLDPQAAQAGLARSFITSVEIQGSPADDLCQVRLMLDAEPVTLDLHPFSMRAENCELFVVEGGQRLSQPLPPSATWRGLVVGEPGSRVAASWAGEALQAVIRRADGQLWHVQPAQVATGAAPSIAIVYRDADVLPDDAMCGVTQAFEAQTGGEDPADVAMGAELCTRVAEIAFDADYEFFEANGSAAIAVIGDIEFIMNAVEFIYAEQVALQYRITAFVLRTDPEDPYTLSDASSLLDEFQDEWLRNQGDVERDVAHLMTGRDLLSSTIGIAFLPGVCHSTRGFGLSQSRFSTINARRVALTAHELGHNWNMPHCNGQTDCAIMCSALGGCTGNLTTFSETDAVNARNYANAVACLDLAEGYKAPLAPRASRDQAATIPNTPVTLDVLANDFDGNCDTVTIAAFPPASVEGGVLTLSVGTGPDGRDELTYHPPPGNLTLDTFVYTVTDGTLTDTGNVFISLLPLKPAIPLPPQVAPGLRVDYYSVAVDSLPDFEAISPFFEHSVPSINFPPTNGMFAGSGENNYVAAVFTGQLSLPAGTYAFYLQSDDGSALYLNGQLVIDHDGVHGMTEMAGSIDLPDGLHDVRVEYFEATGAAGLILSIESAEIVKQVVLPSMWTAPGVTAAYYDIDPPNSVPNFMNYAIHSTSTVDTINFPATEFEFGDSGLSNDVAAVFRGFIEVPENAAYTFFLESDDGSKLFLDNQLVVNHDGLHAMSEASGQVGLGAGFHRLRVEFLERTNTAGLIARVSGGGLSKQVLPAAALRRAICPADVDGNQFVDLQDLGALLSAYGSTARDANWNPAADFDGDGVVGLADLGLLLQGYGFGC